jgi:hypothetical protein
MPLDKPELMGMEKYGSKNKEYCCYCYQNGAFVNPNMTLEDIKKIVREQMEKRKIDSKIISMTINSLPTLKRWRVAVPQ